VLGDTTGSVDHLAEVSLRLAQLAVNGDVRAHIFDRLLEQLEQFVRARNPLCSGREVRFVSLFAAAIPHKGDLSAGSRC
jgi:hypothetical protein